MLHNYIVYFIFCFILCFSRIVFSVGQDGDGYATISPDTAQVGTSGNYTLTYIVDSDIMLLGGGIKVRFAKGYSDPQKTNPEGKGYVSATTSRKSAVVSISSISKEDSILKWDYERFSGIVNVIINYGNLFWGDTIFVNYSSVGSPRSAFKDKILIASDVDGDGIYRELNNLPVIESKPANPFRISIFSQTHQLVGSNFEMAVVCFDKYENISYNFNKEVSFSSTDPLAILPNNYKFTESDSGSRRFNVVLNTSGLQRITVSVIGNTGTEWTSNTQILVQDTEQVYKIYWGDIHSHSRASMDGYGTNSFEYALKGSNLDFYAMTDHCTDDGREGTYKISINDSEWRQLKEDVIKFYQPGKFVTILGYEFSAFLPYGHHNVYFNATNEQIQSIPLFRLYEYKNTLNLWNAFDTNLPSGVDVIAIPHHTGIIWFNDYRDPLVNFGTPYKNDKYRVSLEIYSSHGLSESYNPSHGLSYKNLKKGNVSPGLNYLQDAWVAGEKLGVLASSDDHIARPGIRYKGLTGIYATTLTREAIFDAIKNRRTFGTTGERIILDFSINNKIMGSELTINNGELPQISVNVYGTDNIDFVEVVKWDSLYASYDSLGHPIYDIIGRFSVSSNKFNTTFVDSNFVGPSIYYVRVKQVKNIYDNERGVSREVWAWSSPIWVSPESISSIPNIITLFEANINHNNINLVWQVAPNSQLLGFEIQRNDVGKGYRKIGYIEKDSTLKYSFTDRPLSEGTYKYRLKVLLSSNEYYYTKEVMVNYKLPIKFYLEQNYPNPFNSGTTIMYGISEKSRVRLSVYNILGEEILVLVNKEQNRGNYSIYESFNNLPSGVYFYKLKVNESTITKKMVIIR